MVAIVEGVHNMGVEGTSEVVEVREMVMRAKVHCIHEVKSPIILIGLTVTPSRKE